MCFRQDSLSSDSHSDIRAVIIRRSGSGQDKVLRFENQKGLMFSDGILGSDDCQQVGRVVVYDWFLGAVICDW